MNIFKNTYKINEWIEEQRKRTLDLFLEHEYGVRPFECDNQLKYSIIKQKETETIKIEKVEMKYNNHSMYFYIYLPKKRNLFLKTFVTIVHPLRDKGEELIDDYSCIKDFCPID